MLKARSKQGRPATHGSVACFKYRWGWRLHNVGHLQENAQRGGGGGGGEKQKKTNKIPQEGSSSCCFLGQQAYDGLLTPGLHLCSLSSTRGVAKREVVGGEGSGVSPPCTPPHTSAKV